MDSWGAGCNCDYRVLIRSQENQGQREIGRFPAAGFEDAEGDCDLRKHRSLLKIAKRKRVDSLLEPPRGISPADNLMIVQ